MSMKHDLDFHHEEGRFLVAASKFGVDRAMRIFDNEQKRIHMRRRMQTLGSLTAILLVASLMAPAWFNWWFAIVALFVIQQGTLDARRFVGCGRIYRCNYSIEVMGI